MKKLNGLIAGLVLAAAAPQMAEANNWFQLQGTEPAGVSAPVRVWGFLQPTYYWMQGTKLSGLTGVGTYNNSAGGTSLVTSNNGNTPGFNLVPPQNTSSNTFQLLRARIGVRGVLTPLSDNINYFLLTEFGTNGATASGALGTTPRLTDASITFNQIPGARVRVGLFKTPGPEEALESSLVFDYINFTNVTLQLIQEPFMATGPAGLAGTPTGKSPGGTAVGYVGTPQGNINAFRDTGAQVFDWFRSGPWEFAYAVMVGNGAPLNMTDNNNGKDVYGRFQTSYIFGNSKGPRRSDVTGWVWYQRGNRTFNNQQYMRDREGIGAQYRKGFMKQNGMRFTAEYMKGNGMIVAGSPFVDGTPTVYPDYSNKANGWYVEGGYFATPNLELGARYDKYNRLTNSPADERDFRTITLATTYHFTPLAHVALNYEFRKLDVPNVGAIVGPTPAATTAARNNAQAVADAMDNRLTLQGTLWF